MVRLARVIAIDVPHHVTQRGNARQFILDSDADRQVYLDLLRQYALLHQLAVLGYCLMSNHVHGGAERKLPCGGVELYSARCGILHRFSADSDMVTTGKTRRVVYVFDSVDADWSEPLSEMGRRSRRPFVLVSVRELVTAFHSGLLLYLEELKGERQKRVGAKLGLWFRRVDFRVKVRKPGS